jgi:uncharacterized protein with PQ loop repeat
LHFTLDKKLFVFLSISFFLFTIIGTLTHELGHYAAAKYLGYDAEISYASTSWEHKELSPFVDTIYSNNENEINGNTDFPEKEKFETAILKLRQDSFWITLGGPLQTMLTGTIGLFFLLFQKRKISNSKKVNFTQWLYIFLTLFWLRQLANFFVWICAYLINKKPSFYGDEIRLAIDLQLPIATLALTTACIALIILFIIIFKILPNNIKFTFVFSGIFGGVFGFVFWMYMVGPLILP